MKITNIPSNLKNKHNLSNYNKIKKNMYKSNSNKKKIIFQIIKKINDNTAALVPKLYPLS